MSYVASSSNISTTATVAVTIPSAASIGDYAYLAWAGSDTVTVTDPSGWTTLYSGTNGNLQYKVYRRVLTSGQPGASVTVTASASLKQTALIIVFTDVDGEESTPAVVSVNASSTTRTNPTATLTGSRDVLSFVLSRGNSTLSSWAAPSGWTRVQQIFNSSSGETNGAIAYKVGTAGTVGGDNWTSDIADLRGTTILIVLSPVDTVTSEKTVIVGGVKKVITSTSVIVGGVKKAVTSISVIVGGTKKAIT